MESKVGKTKGPAESSAGPEKPNGSSESPLVKTRAGLEGQKRVTATARIPDIGMLVGL
jgi:hypothetical protein